MIFKKRKGQLSLEFILLLLGIIVAGTVVTLGLAEKSPITAGNKSSEIKKRTMGLFIKEVKFESPGGGLVNNSNETSNNSKLPDLTVTDIEYELTSSWKGKVYVTIKNIGKGKAENFALRLYYPDGDKTKSGLNLNPGESTKVEFDDVPLINGEELAAYVDYNNNIQELDEYNNIKKVKADLTDILPDLTVTDIEYELTSSWKGKVYVTIKNIGKGKAENFALELGYYHSGTPKIKSGLNLKPGESTKVEFDDMWLINGGTLVAYVDYDNKIQESNEYNNIKNVKIDLTDILPDLTVTDIEYELTSSWKGKVYVTIKNIGKGKAENFALELGYYHSGTPKIKSGLNLKPGESTKVEFDNIWLINGKELTAYVDYDDKIQESNEYNNIKKVKIELPDLTVTDIKYKERWFNVNVKVTIKNIGKGKAENFGLKLTLKSSLLDYSQTTDNLKLNPGESKTVEFYIIKPIWYLSSKLVAYVDYNNNIQEVSESNNKVTILK